LQWRGASDEGAPNSAAAAAGNCDDVACLATSAHPTPFKLTARRPAESSKHTPAGEL